MKYDFTFFKKHLECKRRLLARNRWYVYSDYGKVIRQDHDGLNCKNTLAPPFSREDDDKWVEIECKGGYIKQKNLRLEELQRSLVTPLPEDFLQFYLEFGECLLITRSSPLHFLPEREMTDLFEDDPDIDIEAGRFFRFAQYPSESTVYYGLRCKEGTNEWEPVWCTHGLLYSEMIGPSGEGQVVGDSFYDWLQRKIQTDGYPDDVYMTDEYAQFMHPLPGDEVAFPEPQPS